MQKLWLVDDSGDYNQPTSDINRGESSPRVYGGQIVVQIAPKIGTPKVQSGREKQNKSISQWFTLW